MLRFLKTALLSFAFVVWTSFGVLLTYWWWKTLRVHPGVEAWVYVIAEILTLTLLFAVAGFEIAYTDLRDKDPEQLKLGASDLLRRLKAQEDLLYEAREWLGVLLVFLLAFYSEFEPVYRSPLFDGGQGHAFISERVWKFLFTLLFTTLPAVWVAQSPAKHLAITNSEAFLLRTQFVWPILKLVGNTAKYLGLNAVTEVLFKVPSNSWSKHRRNLAPSGPAFYVSSLKRYGYGLHDEVEVIDIGTAGVASLVQVGLIHIVSENRRIFSRKAFLDARCLSSQVQILEAYELGAPEEDLPRIEEQISSCFSTKEPSAGFKRLDPEEFKKSGEPDKTDPKTVWFTIEAGRSLASKENGTATIIKYRFESTWDVGAFDTKEGARDSYRLEGVFPVRCCRMQISFNNSAGKRFANLTPSVTLLGNGHPDETDKITVSLSALSTKSIDAKIAFPLIGGSYGISWQIWDA